MGYIPDLKHKQRATIVTFVGRAASSTGVDKDVDIEMLDFSSSGDMNSDLLSNPEKIEAGARNRLVRNSHADLDSSVLQHNTILRCAAPSSNSIPQPPGITTIPPELLCMIFELLGPVASTCAGLTCHKFYAIHRSYHGQVSLYRRVKDVNGRSHRLIYLLREWMRPNWLIGPRLGSRRPLPCFVRVENWGEWDADKVMADYVMWCEKNLTREEL